jgi:hypothetical protein
MAEYWIAGTQVGGDGATQIAGQQDRTQDRGAWNDIKRHANQENGPESLRKP